MKNVNALTKGTEKTKVDKFMEKSIDRYTSYGIDVEKDLIVGLNVGCNAGNYFCKVVGTMSKDLFKTTGRAISANEVVGIEQNIKDGTAPKAIRINGQLYMMNAGENISGDIKQRTPDILRAVIIYSIARQLAKKKSLKRVKLAEVSLTLGLPIKEYGRNDNAKYLAELVAGVHKVEYQGMDVIISIPKKLINIEAEGYAYYRANYHKYQPQTTDEFGEQENVYIIDAGSGTIDSVWISGGQVMQSETFKGKGTLSLMKELGNAIDSKIGYEAPEAKLEALVRTGKTDLGNGDIFTLEDFPVIVKNYKDTVIQSLGVYKEIASATRIVLIGGGAYLLKDIIAKTYNRVPVIELVEKSELANAEAYYVLSFR
ncbi:ParM/StbA family protein [Clostridium perfringens]|nr:ParM/StbA family protein [Clostridium perfringens]MDK0850261.1 ParM/StbA family protein [Clostridium perfringens]MDM0489870.1 ParM/StbA family protein [Clostridium perfringens]MDM0743544.1 ParM/StbA family protein [Clostridium perfringens]